MKSMIRPKNLTEGPPLKVLLQYSLPMFASMFFQQAYNLADSWIAGNEIGAEALGAVGTCYPVTVFFLAIASGFSMGTSIYCSQRFGAGEHGEVLTGISVSMLSFLPLSLLLLILGTALSGQILIWLAVPAEAMAPTSAYLRIYIAGLPFLFLYNISTGILNGLGDSRTPLIFLILSSVLNIVLDFILVIYVPLGISGLALATLLSQATSSAATGFAVKRLCSQLTHGSQKTRYSLPILSEILKLGIPSVIQHMLMSFGQLALQNIINSYGLIIMTGYSIAFRINGLIVNSLMALCNALSGFIAQNRGARLTGRIRRSISMSMLISFGFSLVCFLTLLTSGPQILRFFVDAGADTEAIVDAGMGFVRIVSPFYLIVFAKVMSDGALRGLGHMNAFMATNLIDVIIRVFFGGLFSRRWGITGVWWIWPTAWIIGTSMSLWLLRRAIKKLPEG